MTDGDKQKKKAAKKKTAKPAAKKAPMKAPKKATTKKAEKPATAEKTAAAKKRAVRKVTRPGSREPEASGGTLRVRQIKSGIGFNRQQKATLKALGLAKIGRERVYPDNPQVRGMLTRVLHLVEVIEQGKKP